MVFNSIEFFIFLSIVFFIYWIILKENLKSQNLLLLVSSYLFYSWWDWRFLSLIFISTLVDYLIGKKIFENHDKMVGKAYLLASITFNLGILAFFKYFNFFIESWINLLSSIGYQQQSLWSLNIILPLGISFYTFQTMSYSLDIYNKRIKPVKNFITFAVFVSFFPQLVAGPIERASNLIPQIQSSRYFKYKNGVEGLRLILWGLFKKVAIADRLAVYVNIIFNDYTSLNGGVLLLGLIYFSFQIYCDFSGYSDIAIGTSKLLGFEIMSNFKFPYFSRDVGEFWRRWHISLSTWFKDYLYIPLGGSKGGKWVSIKNIFIIFIVSGFWHGANWKFIIWGLIHAILYIPLFIRGENRRYTTSIVAEGKCLPSLKELFQMGSTFSFTMLAWVFFRSDSISSAFDYLFKMIIEFGTPTSNRGGIIFILLFVLIEWLMKKDVRNPLSFNNNYIRYCVYIILIIIISCFSGNSDSIEFIYFQF